MSQDLFRPVFLRLADLPIKPGFSPLTGDYDDHDCVVAFASAMVDDGCFHTCEQLIWYFEKPRKWEDERRVWMATGWNPDDARSALLRLEEAEEEAAARRSA